MARIFAVGVFIVAGSARPGAARADGGGPWEQEVRAAEDRHGAAFLAGDLTALEEMFSEDFVVNSPRNSIIQKKQLLEMVRKGTLAISSFEQQIAEIRRFGDVVVVMGGDTVTYAAPSPEAGQTHRRRFTDLWRLQEGRWRFIARQASLICP
jgi:uncharacterized protein (TIGR02246 family)